MSVVVLSNDVVYDALLESIEDLVWVLETAVRVEDEVEVFNVVIEYAVNVFVVLDMVFEAIDICESVDVSRVVEDTLGEFGVEYTLVSETVLFEVDVELLVSVLLHMPLCTM